MNIKWRLFVCLTLFAGTVIAQTPRPDELMDEIYRTAAIAQINPGDRIPIETWLKTGNAVERGYKGIVKEMVTYCADSTQRNLSSINKQPPSSDLQITNAQFQRIWHACDDQEAGAYQRREEFKNLQLELFQEVILACSNLPEDKRGYAGLEKCMKTEIRKRAPNLGY